MTRSSRRVMRYSSIVRTFHPCQARLPLTVIDVVHISLSILDLAGNAAAGATAAAVGAHVNGNPITSEILRLGTVGGVLKAGVLGFATLVSASSGATIANLLSVVLSTFGMSFIVTSWLAQQALPRSKC